MVRDGINWNFLESIAKQTLTLKDRGINSILVGSGAKALGRGNAYRGQRELFEEWRGAFEDILDVGELLLTGKDLRYKGFIRSYILSRTLRGRIMLINGDDSLNQGKRKNYKIAANNDLLAAYIAKLVGADILFLLTNVDGVYDKYGKVVSVINSKDEIERDIEFNTRPKNGVGGMETKVDSAVGFAQSGINRLAYIANGSEENIILRILSGESIGTKVVR